MHTDLLKLLIYMHIYSQMVLFLPEIYDKLIYISLSTDNSKITITKYIDKELKQLFMPLNHSREMLLVFITCKYRGKRR